MADHSIARDMPSPPRMQHLSASEIEQAAQRVAVALGLLSLDAPLCALAEEGQAHMLRFLARMALSNRTWEDAELWARDYHAQLQFGKSFNYLTSDQQNQVAQVVRRIVSGAELYLGGFVEPMNGWTRRATRLGARPSDWLRGLRGGKAEA